MKLKLICAALVCVTAAACVTTPAPLAVLQYQRQDCTTTPDLTLAQSLTPERERSAITSATQVTATTPCIATAEGATTPYVVYALPADLDDKTITIGASLEAARVFAPHVALLDAQGVVTRTFERDQYMYRGVVYSVLFRPRAGESYALVTAEPALVGQRYDSINLATATSGAMAGPVYVSWTTGIDDTQTRVFSYEGTVSVTVHDADTEG